MVDVVGFAVGDDQQQAMMLRRLHESGRNVAYRGALAGVLTRSMGRDTAFHLGTQMPLEIFDGPYADAVPRARSESEEGMIAR